MDCAWITCEHSSNTSIVIDMNLLVYSECRQTSRQPCQFLLLDKDHLYMLRHHCWFFEISTIEDNITLISEYLDTSCGVEYISSSEPVKVVTHNVARDFDNMGASVESTEQGLWVTGHLIDSRRDFFLQRIFSIPISDWGHPPRPLQSFHCEEVRGGMWTTQALWQRRPGLIGCRTQQQRTLGY